MPPHDSHRPRLRALFFDAAGTLFHLSEPVGDTYARIAAKHGVTAEPRALENAFRTAWKTLPSPVHPEGTPPADDDRSWWREVVWLTFVQVTASRDASGAVDDGADAAAVFEPMFAEMYAHFANAEAWQLYEDTIPALEKLREHASSHGPPEGAPPPLRLFVLSNFDRRLHPILEGLGIAHFFEKVLLSSEVGTSKPHPRMFLAALATAADAPASQCLHIGDDEHCDFAGAQTAGMHAALVSRPEVTLLTLAEKVLQNEFPLAPAAKMHT
ncbi:HAD-IA family hydrolase [Roseimicrobium sp. ORNL1]|uniref:HAD-IA family hydrolase n=1 Tax=Roseimicrobium sp. ORNL1 TaxID=2711231 RepID=UPI0013E13BD9|nr:HAD-IA family hydrolase [Roseimicrobium sp. ORNL1]QIF03061.1 HAD-IA family hydrolase [Roseimicrobium sp. ORNL1]